MILIKIIKKLYGLWWKMVAVMGITTVLIVTDHDHNA